MLGQDLGGPAQKGKGKTKTKDTYTTTKGKGKGGCQEFEGQRKGSTKGLRLWSRKRPAEEQW